MTTVRRDPLGAFIGGESYLPSGGAFYNSFDPSTEELNAEVLLATAKDVDVAVKNSLEAQKEWMRHSPGRRGELIWSWTEEFLRNADEIALADTRDMGKVLKDTLYDVQNAAKFAVRYWAGMADKLGGEQIPSKPGYLSYTTRAARRMRRDPSVERADDHDGRKDRNRPRVWERPGRETVGALSHIVDPPRRGGGRRGNAGRPGQCRDRGPDDWRGSRIAPFGEGSELHRQRREQDGMSRLSRLPSSRPLCSS